jgi:hypothetical protein
VSVSGAAGTECTLFVPVYEQIKSATDGQGPGALAGIVQQNAAQWARELEAAGSAAGPTQQSADILNAANFISVGDEVGMSAWNEAVQQLSVALSDCTGQPAGD